MLSTHIRMHVIMIILRYGAACTDVKPLPAGRRQLSRMLSGGVVIDFSVPDDQAGAIVSGTPEMDLDVPGVPPLTGGAGKYTRSCL